MDKCYSGERCGPWASCLILASICIHKIQYFRNCWNVIYIRFVLIHDFLFVCEINAFSYQLLPVYITYFYCTKSIINCNYTYKLFDISMHFWFIYLFAIIYMKAVPKVVGNVFYLWDCFFYLFKHYYCFTVHRMVWISLFIMTKDIKALNTKI
jgi:hypothetical protein